MKEEIVKFGVNYNLIGTINIPPDKNFNHLPCVIFLNAGLTHRIGPNRIYVKLARELSKINFLTFRFDLGGLGDSSSSKTNKDFAQKVSIQDTLEAIDFLSKRKSISKFVLIGICSGADLAFEVALTNNLVVGICMINGTALDSKLVNQLDNIASEKSKERYYKKSSIDLNKWKKVFSGKSQLFKWENIQKRLLDKLTKVNQENKNWKLTVLDYDNTINAFRELFRNNVKVNILLSEGSSAVDLIKMTYFDQIRTFPSTVNFEIIKDVDHIFTLIWSQELLISKVKSWIRNNFTNI